ATAQLAVGLHGPWVLIEILVRPELRRIDEDRDDDKVALGAGGLDQLGVAFVEGTHRRHKADAAAGALGVEYGVANGVSRRIDWRQAHDRALPSSSSSRYDRRSLCVRPSSAAIFSTSARAASSFDSSATISSSVYVPT